MGFIQRLMPAAELEGYTYDYLRKVTDNAPLSVRASKQCAYEGLDRPLDEAMAGKYDQVVRMVKSEDFLEGPRAFAQVAVGEVDALRVLAFAIE